MHIKRGENKYDNKRIEIAYSSQNIQYFPFEQKSKS